MSEKSEAQERKAAEKRVEETREALEKAQQEAAEANQGLVALVTRDVPRVLVEVKDGNTVSDVLSGELKQGGETLELDGPTAISLMQLGHVVIKGEV